MPGDIDSQESTELTESPELTVEQTEDHSTDQVEANPFWGEVEKQVGPNVYKLIQPHLAKADTAARQRVEAVNQSYAPWKAFADQGIEPAHVQQALGVVQQLNTSPEQVFESLRSFLEREGRLPSTTELKQEVIEDEQGDPDPHDAQLKALQEQQQAIMQFFQNQQIASQNQAAAREADTWLETEVGKLQDPKLGYDQADIKEIVRIAAFQAQSTGREPKDLSAAAAQFNAMRDRIRTAPRPGQLAPRLPSGPGGGTPQQTVNQASMTREQRIELATQVMQSRRQA
jgi:hypothetical protein